MKPKLTFFCELESGKLVELFDDPTVIEDLMFLDAAVSLGILDTTPQRASVVRALNEAEISVTAWLLLPREQGYWFNMNNASEAAACYQEFRAWTKKNNLKWSAVGLDIEPDIQEMTKIITKTKGNLLPLTRRALDRQTLLRAHASYAGLVAAIRHDGYPVESYQFPVMIDERLAGSTLLQRLGGLVDFNADREVFMLYSSFLRPYGQAVLCSYAAQAQTVGIGITGGGVELKGIADKPPLSWEELTRDLLLGQRFGADLYVFSLEGCVSQGFLQRLKSFNWDQRIPIPIKGTRRVDQLRRGLRSILWASAHPLLLVYGLTGLFFLLRYIRRKKPQG
jgi:hypothetical protein